MKKGTRYGAGESRVVGRTRKKGNRRLGKERACLQKQTRGRAEGRKAEGGRAAGRVGGREGGRGDGRGWASAKTRCTDHFRLGDNSTLAHACL